MKKKFIIAVLSLVCALMCALGLAACSTRNDDPPVHTHDYAWTDNGDGTHNGHCSVSGCDKPNISNESHIWDTDNKCKKCKAVKPNDEHEHTYSDKWTSAGAEGHYHIATCEHKDEHTDIIPHVYDNETDTICNYCGYVREVVIPHTHDLIPTEANAATCTSEGNITYWYCANCDKYFSDKDGNTEITLADTVITELGHDYATEFTTDQEPTCTEDGSKSKHCSRCEATTEVTVIAATGHSWDDGDVTAEPTCTETGVETYKCSVCLGEKTEEIAALGHDYATEFTTDQEPTCTEEGSKSKHCSRCEATTEVTVIAATGHSWSVEWQYNEDYHWHNCTNDGCTLTNTTLKDGYAKHDFSNDYCVCGKRDPSLPTEGLVYTRNDDEKSYSVTGIGAATESDIVIASVYDGKPVTGIGKNAFINCHSLRSIEIPESVTSIGDEAFGNCSSLEQVKWNATACETAGSETYPIFNKCAKIFMVRFGDKVTMIPPYAFYGCKKLNSIIIPDSVTSIGAYAFSECSHLWRIDLPDSVTSIGNGAFENCTYLSIVTLSNNLTSIGDSGYIFGGCINLEYNEYQDGLYLGSASNSYMLLMGVKNKRIQSFGYESGYEYIHTKFIHGTAFTECELLTSVKLRVGLISIGAHAFWYCHSLTSITIPNSVTSIGGNAFWSCSSLTGITIPNSVTTIENDTFKDCSALKNVRICDGVISIGKRAFSGCTSLSHVTIPNSVTSIADDAFDNCNGIVSAQIPLYVLSYLSIKNLETVILTGGESIEKNMFSNCSNLKTILISDSVTSIGGSAFYGCSSLTKITIPDSVTSIGDAVFGNCSSLTNITIPDSVTSIGDRMFWYCTNLTRITIGSNVTSIGTNAFRGCDNLIEINYTGEITNWCGIQGLKNLMTTTRTLYINGQELTDNLIIPDAVLDIADYAFYNCSKLTGVVIGNGVTRIGEYAFRNCSSLKSITIGNGTTSIGDWAFYNCSSLANITIPDSLTSIGSSAFYGCSNLQYNKYDNVHYLGNDNNPYILLIKAISTDITSCAVHENTKIIYDSAFRGCSSLKSIYYTGDIASWCEIEGLGNLMSSSRTLYINGNEITGILIVPDSVTSIGSYAFRGCNGLTSIEIPDSVTRIGSYAFYGCSLLESITIPDSVTNIGEHAFYDCSSLTSITIPNSITNISEYAFAYCSSLTSITILNSITNISEYAFSNCSSLTSITIPDSVTNIGEYAFSNCSSLTNVTIPDSVTRMGSFVFSGCSALESITLPFVGGSAKTATDPYQYPFGYIFGTSSYTGGSAVTQNYYGNSTSSTISTTYYIPSSLKSVTVTGGNILYGAFYNCSSLTGITILDSVTSIGSSAFSGCRSLKSITLPFVGGSVKTASDLYQYPFGYIFGTSSYTGGSAVIQNYYGNSTSSTTSTTYYIPSSLKSVTVTGGNILYGAFNNCSSLTSITILNSVTSIGQYAVYGCSSLTNLTVASGNTKYHSVGNCIIETASKTLIAGCKTSIIPTDGSVTSIGDQAFRNCSGLTSITIPNGVTSIGGSAFYGCSSLTSITIPSSVTSIGNGAFYGCSSLTSITFQNVSGWEVSKNSDMSSATSLLSADIANASTAATYLTTTYCNYFWKRS